MISITASPEAPPPRIRILDTRQREVDSVRIGDSLAFRIEIPEDSEHLFNLINLVTLFDANLAELTYCLAFYSPLRYLRPQLCRYG